MIESFEFFISCVIATRASFVSVPTNVGASRILCLILRQVMIESFEFFISCVIATRASFISVPTDVGASRILCFILRQVMIESSYKSFTTYGASLSSGAGCVSTGSVFDSICKSFTTYGTSLCMFTSCFVGCVLVLATAGGIDGDAINSNLCRKGECKRILCFGEYNGYNLVADSCGISNGVCASCCVSGGVAYDNNLRHTREFNGCCCSCIETNRIRIITEGIIVSSFTISERNAVLRPNLLFA